MTCFDDMFVFDPGSSEEQGRSIIYKIHKCARLTYKHACTIATHSCAHGFEIRMHTRTHLQPLDHLLHLIRRELVKVLGLKG